jgi:phage protein U
MLMMLGPVQFEVLPFNTNNIGHGHEASFAEKPVLGTRPPLEFVGEGAESWTIKAKLFPEKFGGLDQLNTLYQARSSGQPQYLMRGDGTVMGWVVILSVNERSTYLDARGVGKAIDLDISVKRCDAPSAGLFHSLIEDVFLWATR